MRRWRKILAFLAGLACVGAVFGGGLALAVLETCSERGLYDAGLATPAMKKKIDSLVTTSSGLWQLQAIDAQLYGSVLGLLHTEVVDPFVKALPAVWLEFITGKTNRFDPLVDLATARGKIQWVLEEAVRQKVPWFLVEKIQQRIQRNFTRNVPTGMRLLPLLGVTTNQQKKLEETGKTFASWYNARGWLLVPPFVFFALCLLAATRRRRAAENLAAILCGVPGALMLAASLFARQTGEVLETVLRLRGQLPEEFLALVPLAVPYGLEAFAARLAWFVVPAFVFLVVSLGYGLYRGRSAA